MRAVPRPLRELRSDFFRVADAFDLLRVPFHAVRDIARSSQLAHALPQKLTHVSKSGARIVPPISEPYADSASRYFTHGM